MKKELQQLTQRLEETAVEHGMEISSEKSKIIVNITKPRPSTNIQMDGETLQEVDQFKYSGSTQTKNISKTSKDQTNASTLSHAHDKANNTVEKLSHQFSHRDCTP